VAARGVALAGIEFVVTPRALAEERRWLRTIRDRPWCRRRLRRCLSYSVCSRASTMARQRWMSCLTCLVSNSYIDATSSCVNDCSQFMQVKTDFPGRDEWS